jgi:hypothetical protein
MYPDLGVLGAHSRLNSQLNSFKTGYVFLDTALLFIIPAIVTYLIGYKDNLGSVFHAIVAYINSFYYVVVVISDQVR